MQPQSHREAGMSQSQRADERRRLRDRYSWLSHFTDEEIEKISFCENGAEMVPGELYFDISNPEHGAFVGQPGQLIPEGGCLVSRSDVPSSIWAKLTSYPSRR